MDKYIDIAIAEGAEDTILISAPLNELQVGNLVEIDDSGKIFRVLRSMVVQDGGNEHQFLSLAHGGEIFTAKRVFRLGWKASGKEECDTAGGENV